MLIARQKIGVDAHHQKQVCIHQPTTPEYKALRIGNLNMSFYPSLIFKSFRTV
jgi:hypothetical protein